VELRAQSKMNKTSGYESVEPIASSLSEYHKYQEVGEWPFCNAAFLSGWCMFCFL